MAQSGEFGQAVLNKPEAGTSPRGRSVLRAVVTACLLGGLLVLVPVAAKPALASPSGILILSTSVNGGASSAEAEAAVADGYSVTVANATTWDSMSESTFAGYQAIVLGDASASSSCASSTSSSLAAATSDIATWSAAVTGNVAVVGSAPAFAAESASNPSGANAFLDAAIRYAASGSATGLYVSLDCYYSTATSGTAVSILADIGGGGFAVAGQGGASCNNSGTLNEPVADAAGVANLDDADLDSWPCTVQEGFTGYPSGFSVLGFDRAVSSSFTTADGMSGQPYLLINNSTQTPLVPAGGDVATSSTYGLSNSASPGITDSVTTAADAVNPATGDFSESYTDFSIPTYGPSLTFTRTYDAKLAQQEAITGTPGPMGYGWSDKWGASLSSGTGTGDLYTLDGAETNNGDGGSPTSAPLAQPMGEAYLGGNLYIADFADNRVQEVAGATGTQWGISMHAGDIYTIAGSPIGASGASPNGTVDTSSLLWGPTGVVMDASNDLLIADQENCRVVELARSSGTQWGVPMTANDIYTIAGSASGNCGDSSNGTTNTSALLDAPSDVRISASNLFIADSGNNRVIEIPASNGTNFGISMSADKIYDVAGGTLGDSPNGTTATSAKFSDPCSVVLDGSDNLIIADYFNNRVIYVPQTTGTWWGIPMTADKIYDIAGNVNGTAGHTGDGSSGPSAYLNGPDYVQFADNDLYIADSGNNRVQEVPWSSQTQWNIVMTSDHIYTIAGSASGTGGYSGDGGLAASALMDLPSGIHTDSSGDLDISDLGNNVVRQVNVSTYDISTYAGTGGWLSTDGDDFPAPGGGLYSPSQVAVDGSGNVYIADEFNNRIQEIAANSHTQWGVPMTAGDVYTIAGLANGVGGDSGDGSAATLSELNSPQGVAVDAAGDLFIADTGSCRIREVPAQGGVNFGHAMTADHMYTIAGTNGTCGLSGNGGSGTSADLFSPEGLALDAAGDVVIADSQSNEVRILAATSHTQWGISVTTGDIYRLVGSSSGSSGTTGDGGVDTSGLLYYPQGVMIDSAGDLYIADSQNNRIQEVAEAGGVQWGITMTANDVYTVAGSSSGAAGLTGDGGSATAARLDWPEAVSVDPAGNLYVADTANNRIQEVAASTGVQWGALTDDSSMTADDVYTIAGSATGTAGFGGDGALGTASGSLLNTPAGVVVDAMGNLYISDTANNRLRELAAGSDSVLQTTPVPSAITFNDGSGAEDTFYPQTGGSCSPPLVVNGGYCTLPEVLGILTYHSGTNTYSLLTPDQQTDTFNGLSSTSNPGALVSEEDSAGDTLNITYGSPTPGSGDCLSTAHSCDTITSASGRALIEGFNAVGQLTSVSDPMDRTWTYGYGSVGDLVTATDPMNNVTSFTYDTGNADPVLVHDVLTVTKPNGQPGGPDAGAKTVNTYDSLGRVTTQTDPAGWETTFNYSGLNTSTGDGQVVVTDPDGNKTTYEYQAGVETSQYVGYDPSASAPAPADTFYSPKQATLLPDVTVDPDGATTTDAYDTEGSIISVTNALGEETTQGYSGTETQDCSTTPLASAASKCASLSPPSAVSPAGVITPPTSAPPLGVTYSLTDTDGNVLYTTTGVYEPGAPTASYSQTSYSLYAGNSVTLNSTNVSCTSSPPSASLPCATINADGVVTQLGYDSVGNLASASTPDGNGSQVAEETYTYNGDGEQTAAVAADGNLSGANVGNYTTVTGYNADGNVTSTTEAGGTGATVTPRTTDDYYDGNGNETSSKDARGFTTYNTYNADDEETVADNPDGSETLTCYDGDGNVTETVPPVGVAASSLTPASCPTSYPTGYGDRLATDATTYTYDANGDKVATTTPAPAGQTGYETTSYNYDGAGDLIETVAPPTSNAGGAPNDDTYDAYNALGQLTSTTTGYGTSVASTTSYCYNPEGDQTAVVAPDGNTSGTASCEPSAPWIVSSSAYPTEAAYQTTSSYDSTSELVSTTLPATSAAPSGITTSFTYDAQGNKLTSTDEIGVVTTYTFTPSNLVASISYSGSAAHAVSYTYDADGNNTAMTDASGSSSYVYDPFGELISSENGASQTIAYTYDADRDTTAVTYPLPSSAIWPTTDTVGYGFDNADELISVTDFNGSTIGISNTADGLPYSETLGSSGDSIGTTYDPTDTASAIELKNGSNTLLGFSYSDAPSGAILSETDTPSSSQSPADYTYDAQSRVTSMIPGSGSTLDYGFDASGNLTTLPTGATGTYDGAGELTSSVLSGTTTSYTYDADGDRTLEKQGSTTVTDSTWNGAAELTSYSDGAADMTSATYNGNGLRTSDTTTPAGGSPTTQGFVWDMATSGPSMLMDANNAYIAVSGTPIEQVNLSSGTVAYLVTDSLGSVRGIVASSGSLTAATAYDGWGNPEGASDGLSSYTPFGFAGAYTDNTGLSYLVHRYYDAATGQLLSIDPLFHETNQQFTYTDGDPINATDPDGELYAYSDDGSLSCVENKDQIPAYLWNFCFPPRPHHPNWREGAIALATGIPFFIAGAEADGIWIAVDAGLDAGISAADATVVGVEVRGWAVVDQCAEDINVCWQLETVLRITAVEVALKAMAAIAQRRGKGLLQNASLGVLLGEFLAILRHCFVDSLG
jgi:RHS repeat-associated protein